MFIGYESGAIGLFKLWLSEGKEDTYKIEHLVYISPHRVITDLKTKHVLCMLPVENKQANPLSAQSEFKLVIGYYAQYLQAFDIMQSSDNMGYVFID